MPWTNEPPLADAVSGLAAATCDAPSPGAGHRIYALGGYDGTLKVATAAAYDTSAKTWSPISPMNTARAYLGATSGPGRLYALGGMSDTEILAAHEIYDPAADTWSSAAPLPTARTGLAAVTGRDGLIYALGGENISYILGTVEAYDPATGAWTSKEPMPTPRILFAAVTGPDGLIYTIGGAGSSGTVNTVEVFDPTTNSWTTGPSLPAARVGLAAAVGPDGLIYAMGGWDNAPAGAQTTHTTVYSYNPATGGGWVQQPPLLAAQANLAAATGPDGLIYAIGGTSQTTSSAPQSILDTVEAFTRPRRRR